MICARQGCTNEATMIHSRRWRKRTQDWYVVKWCNSCQTKRVNHYNKNRRRSFPDLSSAEKSQRIILIDQSKAQQKRLIARFG